MSLPTVAAPTTEETNRFQVEILDQFPTDEAIVAKNLNEATIQLFDEMLPYCGPIALLVL